MDFSRFEKKLIKNLLERDVVRMYEKSGDLFVDVRSSTVVRVATVLYADSDLEFRVLLDAFAIDMLKQKGKFEIYYQLYSNKLKSCLFIVVDINEYETVPSLSLVFKNVAWYEREIFDMFGVLFSGHEDLRKILTSHDSQGFSLRKEG